MTSKKEAMQRNIKINPRRNSKNKLNKIYGISIDKSMSHQQSKEIRNKINKLMN